jgi:hypothetical protein
MILAVYSRFFIKTGQNRFFRSFNNIFSTAEVMQSWMVVINIANGE